MHCPQDMKPQPFHNGRAVSWVDFPEMLTGCKSIHMIYISIKIT